MEVRYDESDGELENVCHTERLERTVVSECDYFSIRHTLLRVDSNIRVKNNVEFYSVVKKNNFKVYSNGDSSRSKSNYKYKRREPCRQGGWDGCLNRTKGGNCKLTEKNLLVNSVNSVKYNPVSIVAALQYFRWALQYVRGVKMLRSSPNFMLLTAIVVTYGLLGLTEAGVCWTKRLENGKCTDMYMNNISKEECCNRGQEFGYTEQRLSEVEIFFASAIGDGAKCEPCLDSCHAAKCKPGRMCVIRKGRPKCICAPQCRGSKDKKNKNNPIQNENEDHRNRHQYNKKKKKKKQRSKMREQHKSNSRNATIPLGSPRRQQNHRQHQRQHHNNNNNNNNNEEHQIHSHTNHQHRTQIHHQQQQQQQQHHLQHIQNRRDPSSRMITLDEKIGNELFNHGFPYPPTDLSLISQDPYYNPVCGTDGKTYKTECQLKKRACRQDRPSLIVAYRGQCQTSCEMVRCVNDLTCVEDQYGIPHCISCKITCPQDDLLSPIAIDPKRAVCGADGHTYKSICDINRVVCRIGRSIPVAYEGPCRDAPNCDNVVCGDKKVCLTDLVTHKPRCVSCNFKCPRKRRPQGQRYEDTKLCGNNNHTYHSWCHLRRDSCNTGIYIDIRHNGACHKDSFPSNGIHLFPGGFF